MAAADEQLIEAPRKTTVRTRRTVNTDRYCKVVVASLFGVFVVVMATVLVYTHTVLNRGDVQDITKTMIAVPMYMSTCATSASAYCSVYVSPYDVFAAKASTTSCAYVTNKVFVRAASVVAKHGLRLNATSCTQPATVTTNGSVVVVNNHLLASVFTTMPPLVTLAYVVYPALLHKGVNRKSAEAYVKRQAAYEATPLHGLYTNRNFMEAAVALYHCRYGGALNTQCSEA